MTVRALALHKACVQPLGGRTAAPRTALAAVRTPVVIPQADPAEFERGREILRTAGLAHRDDPIEPWIRDGRAWRPLRRFQVRGYDLAEPISPGEFMAWLTGDPPAPGVQTNLDRAFLGSPLSPRLPEPSRRLRRPAETEILDGDALGAVGLDEREACADAVRRIAAEEILICGRNVLVPFRPHVRFIPGEGRLRETLVLTPEAKADEPLLRMRDRVYANSLKQSRKRVEFLPEIVALRSELPQQDDGTDLRVMAGVLPGAIRRALAPFIAGRIAMPTGNAVEGAISLDGKLTDIERRAAFGILPDHELPDAFEAIFSARRLIGMHTDGLDMPRRQAYRCALEFCTAIAFPRTRTVPTADADALSGLAL